MKSFFAAGVFLIVFGSVAHAQVEDFTLENQEVMETDSMEILDANQVDPQRIIRRVYECRARNARGQTFRGIDRNRGQAQRRALRNCYQYSRACQVVSCRTQWRIGAAEEINQ